MNQTPPANPFEALLGLASGLFVSRVVWSIAEVGVADAIGDGPTPLAEIAERTGCDPTNLGRMLDAAVSFGLLTKPGDGTYGHGPLSPLLRSDHPASQRAFVRSVFGGEHYAAWGNVEASLRRGVTAFDDHYRAPVFDWFARNPAQAELFSHAMESSTRLAEAAIMMSWSPPAFTMAMDVGGSRGTLIGALLAQRPDARGILFDLPEIIEKVAPSLANDRLEAVAGDFFVGVPAADLYLLKFILHDWTDEQSLAILANIRAACAPGAHVAIIENVLPETVAPHPGYLMDLNMMVMTGGKERTAAEFAALLEQAGFRYEGVTPTPSPFSVVRALAV